MFRARNKQGCDGCTTYIHRPVCSSTVEKVIL